MLRWHLRHEGRGLEPTTTTFMTQSSRSNTWESNIYCGLQLQAAVSSLGRQTQNIGYRLHRFTLCAGLPLRVCEKRNLISTFCWKSKSYLCRSLPSLLYTAHAQIWSRADHKTLLLYLVYFLAKLHADENAAKSVKSVGIIHLLVFPSGRLPVSMCVCRCPCAVVTIRCTRKLRLLIVKKSPQGGTPWQWGDHGFLQPPTSFLSISPPSYNGRAVS